ncbi:MAG: nuclear transport factor 2 family protein [Chthoniobacterales bacterium]
MKKLLSCITIALLTTITVSTAAPSEAGMMAKEKAAWHAFKDKDAAGFQKVVDHDVVGVYSDGISGMQGELDGMKKWNMKSFKISDFKSHSDEKDVCVTSYKIAVVGTVDGKDASGTYYAGSVWKMENGQWLAIFHTNAQKKE